MDVERSVGRPPSPGSSVRARVPRRRWSSAVVVNRPGARCRWSAPIGRPSQLASGRTSRTWSKPRQCSCRGSAVSDVDPGGRCGRKGCGSAVVTVQPSARAIAGCGQQVASRFQVGGRWSGQSARCSGRQPRRSRRQSSTVQVGKCPAGGGEEVGNRAMSVQVGGATGRAMRSSGRAMRSQVLRRLSRYVGRRVLMPVGIWVRAMASRSAGVRLGAWAGGRRSRCRGGVRGWGVACPGETGLSHWSEAVRWSQGRGAGRCQRVGTIRAAGVDAFVSGGRHGVIVVRSRG